MQETMVQNLHNENSENLTGVINGFTVSSFLQILELEQKTCCLQVHYLDMQGTLYIHCGTVIDAEVDNLHGEEAAVLILSWDTAKIQLENFCEKRKKVIHSSLTRLIIEGSRRKDESRFEKESSDELQRAISLIEGHHFQQAHRLLSTYVKAHPDNTDAWFWYSRCLGKLEAIAFALSKCSQFSPADQKVIEEIKKLDHAQHAQVNNAKIGRCPFCWSPLDRSAQTCHYCKGSLIIAEALHQDTLNQLDSNALIDAVTRYTNVVAREKNVKAYYFLSLANCNLNKADEALDLLNETSRMFPGNQFIERQLNIVLNHVTKRLIKYEKTKRKKKNNIRKSITPEISSKKKILVVEDSPTTRKVVVLTLKQKGYDMIEAQDGLEALSKIDEERPDLVLLDIILPKMDGYKILSIIKENEELKDIPVVMLTSKDGLIDKFKGKLAGSDAYLTKPFEPTDLIRTVRRYIAK
jgi:twitching motility two-component system response regulator PilG